MKRISRKLPFLTFLTLATGCAAYMSYFQSSFFSKFSLQELVQRSKAAGPLNCSTRAGGGGGGGIGTGGGGIGTKQSSFSKGESFSCQLTDTEKFDEPRFIQALKQNVESDLNRINAKVTSEKLGAANFYLEYSSGDISGRVEISGKRGPLNYYTLTADLKEKRGEAK
jgi:hypothetical protein